MLAEGILLMILSTASLAVPSETLRWTQVRNGLSRQQVSGLLGEPLMRNAARGYERWVYDGGCEVQFTRGEVSAWTAPKASKPPAAPVTRRDSSASERRT
jgi:hypothetical protein